MFLGGAFGYLPDVRDFLPESLGSEIGEGGEGGVDLTTFDDDQGHMSNRYSRELGHS